MILSTSLWDYSNFETVTNKINELIDHSMLMTAVKVLALSFILINLIQLWFESKKESGKSLTFIEILSSFAYILIIVLFPYIFEFINTIMSLYNNFVIDLMLSATKGETIHSYYASGDSSNWGFTKGISNVLINVLEFIGWIVNTTSFAMYMLERSFLLIAMNLILPMVLALASLKKFRDLISNWITTYLAIYLTGALFIAVSVFIDIAYSFFLEIVRSENPVIGNTVKIGLVTVFIFAKVKLLAAAVTLSYKIIKS